jgi:hypothetical protein
MPACKPLIMAMTLIAGYLGAPVPARSDVEAPPDVCDRPEDCQRIFEAQRRDEPWDPAGVIAIWWFLERKPAAAD